MTRKNYEEEAIKLSKAIDIAIESFEKFPREIWTKGELTHIISCYTEWKYWALNPEPKFRKIVSLNYIINDVFIIFQESSGKDVDYFWKQIEKQNLGYIREDKLGKIMKRGKINNLIEYEYAIDIIVVAEQEKRITVSEAEKLAKMIGVFEMRKIKNGL